MRIYICSLLSSFFGGAALALMISYPIPEHTLYVCFWALFVALWSCILGGWAIADWAVLRERVKFDHMVGAIVEKLLADRGLRSVDEP